MKTCAEKHEKHEVTSSGIIIPVVIYIYILPPGVLYIYIINKICINRCVMHILQVLLLLTYVQENTKVSRNASCSCVSNYRMASSVAKMDQYVWDIILILHS